MAKPTNNDNNVNNFGDNGNAMIVQLTVAELRTIMRTEVERVLSTLQVGRQPSRSDRWVDVSGAAEHFKVSDKTIRNWIKAGAPVRTFGPSGHAMIRIDLPEFEAWVDHAQRPREVETR